MGDHEELRRKHIRLDLSAYNAEGAVCHVTICTEAKRSVFGDAPYADMVYRSILDGPMNLECELLVVCVMPDHVHILIRIMESDLVGLIRRWKAYTTNQLNRAGVQGKIWQRSFYDHILRADEDVATVVRYIINNPVRVGITEDASTYPFAWHRWME